MPVQRRQHRRISIHALHEESDLQDLGYTPTDDISIHALHEESDPSGDSPTVTS